MGEMPFYIILQLVKIILVFLNQLNFNLILTSPILKIIIHSQGTVPALLSGTLSTKARLRT